MTTISEDYVFALLPFDVKRPADVRVDGQGGITPATYAMLVDSVMTELEVRLTKGAVPTAQQEHKLLQQAGALLVAGAICRKLKTYQDQANSMFADANVKIRLFFDGVMGSSEGGQSAEVVIESISTALTDTDYASSASFLSVFGSLRV